jgi:hypothetical protein
MCGLDAIRQRSMQWSKVLKVDHSLPFAGLAIILAFALLTFAGIGFNLGVEGDDIFYLSPFLRQWQIDRDLGIASTVALRQTLVNTYILIYEALGQSQQAVHAAFSALWATSGILCYTVLRRSFSKFAATASALLFLVYSGKYEVLGWASAGLHILVLCLLLLMIMVIQAPSMRFGIKMMIVSGLYWISLLYYEILLPLAPLPFLWWFLVRRKSALSWADGAFAALPLVATAAHLYVLSTAAKPIWERSGEISIHHISQSIPGTLIKTLDAAFGYRHLSLLDDSWSSALYLIRNGIDLTPAITFVAFACIAICLVFGFSEMEVKKTRSAPWVFFSFWLIIMAPVVTSPLVMGMPFAPSRLTYLPSLGAAIIVAVAVDRYRGLLMKSLLMAWILIEVVALQSILYQYASTTLFDDRLRNKIKQFDITFSPGDHIIVRTAHNPFIYNVWLTVPSKMDNGGQSLLLIDNEYLLPVSLSIPMHQLLTYSRERYDDPRGSADYIFVESDDGRLCWDGQNICR